jgi:hypothetical protein
VADRTTDRTTKDTTPNDGQPGSPPANRRPRRSSDRQSLTPGPKRSRTPLSAIRPPDYLVIGHICADLQSDGSVLLGGTALYSALTAAKLGWRTAILTKGAFGLDFNGMKIPGLDQYAEQIDIIVQQADGPTVFRNEYQAGRRVQSIRHWAQPIDLTGLPPHWRNPKILHLGPVAQEIDQRQAVSLQGGFIGATPQGWMRDWPRAGGGRVTHGQLRIHAELLDRLDSVIVSIDEYPYSRQVVDRVASRRLGVVTFDERGSRIIHPEIGTPRGTFATRRQQVELPGFKVDVQDSTGAGDVFAAAFFIGAVDPKASAERAGTFANATAALSLRAAGPTGIPSRAEVDAIIAAREAER